MMNKLFKDPRTSSNVLELSQTQNKICPLPPIRLQSGEYHQPVKIINFRNVVTDEVIRIVNIELTFISYDFANWSKDYPRSSYNSRCVYVYFLTACNINGLISQYFLHESKNDRCRLHGGDLIRIKKTSLFPVRGTLIRPIATLEEFELVKSDEESLISLPSSSSQNQGTEEAVKVLQRWTKSYEETKEILEAVEQFGYPSLHFYKLNYWAEQCPYIPNLQVNIYQEVPLSVVGPMISFFNIAEALNHQNFNLRVTRNLVAVVLNVKKPTNYLTNAPNSVFPLKTVLTIMDNSGSCDLVLWNEMAAVAQVNLQIGALILLKDFKIKHCKSDQYALIHPNAERVLVELSIEQGVNVCSAGTITKLPQSYLKNVSFPNPFYNFDSISNAENWQHNQVISVIGVVVGISRYQLKRGSDFHIGRYYGRYWIELGDINSGSTVTVCLYLNRCIERHSAVQLNSILCLTNLLVKHEEADKKLQFSCLNSGASTEIFVIPGPGDDNLPSFIQTEAERIKESLQRNEIKFISWMGGIHPFENYYLDFNCYEQMLTDKCFGLDQLEDAVKLSITNHSIDFVFPSRIVQVEVQQLPARINFWTQNQSVVISADYLDQNVLVWKSEEWESLKTDADIKLYDFEKVCYESLMLAVDAGNGVSKILKNQMLQFPVTNMMDLMERMTLDDDYFTADVFGQFVFKITFQHLTEDVVLSAVFNAEMPAGELETFKDLLSLNYEPRRKAWESPVSKQSGNMTSIEFNFEEDEVFMPWIRMQCFDREHLQFQLLYLRN